MSFCTTGWTKRQEPSCKTSATSSIMLLIFFWKYMNSHNDSMQRYLGTNLDVPGSMLIASANVNWIGFLENLIKHKDHKIYRYYGVRYFSTSEYIIIFICFSNFILRLDAWNLPSFTWGININWTNVYSV